MKNGKIPPCFARKWWSVFLYTDEDIRRTIAYVENNPIKAGYKAQTWPFVKKYG